MIPYKQNNTDNWNASTPPLSKLLWNDENNTKRERINYNQNSRIKTMRVWLLSTILRKICEREGHELIPVNLT